MHAPDTGDQDTVHRLVCVKRGMLSAWCVSRDRRRTNPRTVWRSRDGFVNSLFVNTTTRQQEASLSLVSTLILQWVELW